MPRLSGPAGNGTEGRGLRRATGPVRPALRSGPAVPLTCHHMGRAGGRPLREPIAWSGPIVMNTEDELREAFAQLDDGTFLEVHP